MYSASALLVALAGPSSEQIVMCSSGDKKYATIHHPLTEADSLDHLTGGKARGANCRYPDGRARGLCWDANESLRENARLREKGDTEKPRKAFCGPPANRLGIFVK